MMVSSLTLPRNMTFAMVIWWAFLAMATNWRALNRWHIPGTCIPRLFGQRPFLAFVPYVPIHALMTNK